MGGACVAWLSAAAVEFNVPLQWLWFAFIRLKKVELLQQQDTPLYMAVTGHPLGPCTGFCAPLCILKHLRSAALNSCSHELVNEQLSTP
jgi:hypothetical protein